MARGGPCLNAGPMRVATFNVGALSETSHTSGARLDAFQGKLAQDVDRLLQNVDVLLLQELGPAHVEAARPLESHYQIEAHARRDVC